MELFTEPNKYAAAPRAYKIYDGVEVQGYQKYRLTDKNISTSDIKFNALKPCLEEIDFNRKTVLDLGASAGLYSFYALNKKASQVTSVDMDVNYTKMVTGISEHFKIRDLFVINKNISELDIKADIVFALALIHWIYSCTSFYGSLDKVVEKLRCMTNETLILEWIDPKDRAINFLGHTDFNKDQIIEPYTKALFLKALSKHFESYELIARVSPTREIYKCVVGSKKPEPFREEETFVKKSPLSATSEVTIDREKNVVTKRVAQDFGFDLVTNEVRTLRHLWRKGCRFIPFLLNYSEDTIEMEYMGEPVTRETLPDNWEKQVERMLNLLSKHGVRHNDIKPQEILVKNGKLALVDFGWSTRNDKEAPDNWPKAIGGKYRKNRNELDDFYSIHKSIEDVLEGAA